MRACSHARQVRNDHGEKPRKSLSHSFRLQGVREVHTGYTGDTPPISLRLKASRKRAAQKKQPGRRDRTAARPWSLSMPDINKGAFTSYFLASRRSKRSKEYQARGGREKDPLSDLHYFRDKQASPSGAEALVGSE